MKTKTLTLMCATVVALSVGGAYGGLTASSGSWTDGATWGGSVPTAGENNTIKFGHDVTISSNTVSGIGTYGSLTMLGQSTLTLNGGNYKGSGNVLLDNKNQDISLTLNTFEFRTQAGLYVDAGNTGATNTVHVKDGSLFFQTSRWGKDGGGIALLHIDADSGSIVRTFGASQDATYGTAVFKYSLQADGTVADWEFTNGGASLLATGNALIIDDSKFAGSHALGTEIILMSFDNAGAVGVSGTFGSVTMDAGKYELNYDGGDGNDLSLTVIPEPAALGLIVLGGGGMLWVRRFFAA